MPDVRRIALAYNNVYVVESAGERLLIDTGPDYAGAWETLTGGMSSGSPALVIATHGHLDHAGLGRRWQAAGVPVAVGAADLPLVRAPLFSRPGHFEAFGRFVDESGAPAAVTAEALDALTTWRARTEYSAIAEGYAAVGRGGRWPTALRYPPYEPNHPVDDGQSFGGAAALICPGHTPGNLVVVEESEGWLFSGDQLLPDITPTPAIQARPEWEGEGTGWRFRSLPAFVHSLRRLAAMEFSVCYPGHGEPFTNVREVIAQNLEQVEVRSQRLWEELRTAGPQSVYTAAERMYPRALRKRFWQIIATVQGHLDLLEDEGKVRAERGRYEALG